MLAIPRPSIRCGFLLAAAALLSGCSDVVVGYFSGTESASASDSSTSASSEDGASTTTVAQDGTSLGSTSETSGEGFVPPGCFFDDFEDGVVDEPNWSTWAEADASLEEVGGQLRLTPPTYGLYDTGVVGRFDRHFPFDRGSVELHVITPPPVEAPAGLFLMVGDPPNTLSIRLAGGNLQVAGSVDEQLVFEELFPLTPYPSWIGIRGEGTLAHFEISMDGQTWVTIATHDKPGTFDDASALIMAQTFGDYPDRTTVVVDDLEVCIQ